MRNSFSSIKINYKDIRIDWNWKTFYTSEKVESLLFPANPLIQMSPSLSFTIWIPPIVTKKYRQTAQNRSLKYNTK